MKTCPKCLIEKPLEAFAKDRSRRDGRQFRCKACQAQYRADNKERLSVWFAQHYVENRERKLEQAAQYRAENREQINAWHVQYHKTPTRKEAALRARTKRRTKMQEIEVSFTAQEHEELLRIYDGRCYVCRLAPATTLDHVIPLSKVGAHTAANLRPCCKSCNSSKNAKDVLDWLAPKWRPVWGAPLVPNYEPSQRHKDDLARVLERI